MYGGSTTSILLNTPGEAGSMRFRTTASSPGRSCLKKNGALVWALIASVYIGNVMLLILNLPLVGLWDPVNEGGV